jgi:26S proteasome regulatory subunit T1
MCFIYKGIKESDTGLAPPALWDLAADKQALHSEQPLQVTKIVHYIHSTTVWKVL